MQSIYTEEYHGHIIRIYADDDAPSPRDDDNLGTMVCWHGRYDLGDLQPRQDSRVWLENWLGLTIAQTDQIYARAAKNHVDSGRSNWRVAAANAYRDALMKRFARNAVVLPLYLYDHSGITMNTTGFYCPWDSGQVGFIFVSLEDVRREFGKQRITAAIRESAEAVLRAEVSTYDQYLRGEVYGFVTEKDGREQDSCWGFFGDYEEHCLAEARSIVDSLDEGGSAS